MTQNPTNVTVNENELVRMECKFSGDPKPVLIWEKDRKTLPNDLNFKTTRSGNASVLTINGTTGENTGAYRCVATLQHIFERTKEATLFVRGKINAVACRETN